QFQPLQARHPVPPPLLEVSAETERHFGRRVLNHKPLDPGAAGPWLAWISRARALQGDAFAAWVARLPLFQSAPRGLVWNRVPSLEGLELLAAFAWHSSAGKGAARSAVGRPWSEATTLRTAVEEIQDWVQRIFQIYCPASVEDGSPWHESRTVSGYEFVPLLTGPDLRMEASRMDNCLDRYPRRVRAGMCMIYSIRKDGRSVADLEVRPSGRHRSQPVIAHILGPSNHAVTRTVRAAAETWLAGQTTALMIGRRSSEVIDPEEWAACWRLYREAVPQSGLFAEEDHIAQSYAIQTAAAQLSIIARTGVVTL
ncbi:MAG: hypothetical protein AAFV62_13565, partial [Pseudomonadota bacterium]